MSNIGGREILSPTPGSTVTITIDTTVPHSVATWTASQAESIVISGTPLDGHILTCIITNDGVLGRLLTFSTGLLSTGTLLGTIGKKSVITFIAIGGIFTEVSRSLVL